MICRFGHRTQPGQRRCPVCGEVLTEDRRESVRDKQSDNEADRHED